MANFEIRLPTAHGDPWPRAIPTLQRLDAPPLLLVPLALEASAVVHPRPAGTRVAIGEALTESPAESAHRPIAPAGGILGAIREVVLAGAGVVPAMELQVDHRQEDAISDARVGSPPGDLGEPSRQHLPALIDALGRSGVCARRHTSPNLLTQLLHVLRRPIDMVLCNLLDTDPPLRLQALYGGTAGDQIVAGVTALREWSGAGAAWIVVDDSTPAAWLSPLRRAIRAARNAGAAPVRLIDIANDYPQADPSLLIHRLLDRRLRPGRSPVEQGVLLIDGPATVAVSRSLRDAAPLTRTPVAVFDHFSRPGHTLGRTHYRDVPVGTRVADLLDALNLDCADTTLRCGALLRDLPIDGSAVIGGGELTIHLLPRQPLPEVHPCIRCGWCVQGCPTRIHPAGLLEAAQHEDRALAEHYGLEACIECGICSYVCPSNLPLLAGIRQLRARPSRTPDHTP